MLAEILVNKMFNERKFLFGTVTFSVLAVVTIAFYWFKTREHIHTLTIATGSTTGEYYAFGQALAQIVDKHSSNIQIEVLATSGSQENQQLINNQEVELAVLQADTTVGPSTQAITFLFPEVFHLIANQNSGIKHFRDIKGKKIALMPEGSGSYDAFWPISQHYGFTEQDFEVIPMPSQEAHEALLAGEVDALFRIIALGNSSVTQLLSNPQIEIVPIEQAGALQLFYPSLQPYTIPQGTYNGAIPTPSEDLPVVGVRAVLVTDRSVDPYIIQEITRIIFEKRNELIRLHSQSATIVKPDYSQELGFSFHQGAKSYYNQDEPSFLERYAESIGLILSVSMLIASGIWQFKMWLQEKQKNRADKYNLEIITLVDQINSSKSLEELDSIRNDLFTLFNKVVHDLDRDRISAESFQSFTFPWDVAFNSMRHREMLFLNLQSDAEDN